MCLSSLGIPQAEERSNRFNDQRKRLNPIAPAYRFDIDWIHVSECTYLAPQTDKRALAATTTTTSRSSHVICWEGPAGRKAICRVAIPSPTSAVA